MKNSKKTDKELREAAEILLKEFSLKGDWYKAMIESIAGALREYGYHYFAYPFEATEETKSRITDIATSVTDRIIGLKDRNERKA